MAEFAPTVDRFPNKVFAVWCDDGPDARQLRNDHLAGHLHHVEKHCERYIVAGPMRDTPDSETSASLFLIVAESAKEALELCEHDPYFSSGMYKNIRIMNFTPALGKFLGGVIWPSVEAVVPFATKPRPAGG